MLCYIIIASKKGLAADAGADRGGMNNKFAKTRGQPLVFSLSRIFLNIFPDIKNKRREGGLQ